MEPTRGENNLDLFFTTNPSLVKNSTVVPGISDHDMVVTDCEPIYNRPKPRKTFHFSKANWDKIECATKKFRSAFEKTFSQPTGVCLEILSTVPSKTWYFRKIKQLVITCCGLHPKLNDWSEKNTDHITKQKNQALIRTGRHTKNRKNTQSILKKTCWSHLDTTLTDNLKENNTKPFWKHIKNLRQDNVGVTPIKHKGKLHSDSKTKAELLNHQFQSVFTQGTSKDKLLNPAGPFYPPIGNLEITYTGIKKSLENLNTKKAVGPDAIPNLFLKSTASESAKILQIIFKQSLQTGCLLKDWRDANVSPIFKKGDRHQTQNYRPVSLTSISCKILEHIIVKQILNHFDLHKILTKFQHGFRSGLSCETQL